jgi:hypothetical protein
VRKESPRTKQVGESCELFHPGSGRAREIVLSSLMTGSCLKSSEGLSALHNVGKNVCKFLLCSFFHGIATVQVEVISLWSINLALHNSLHSVLCFD